MGGAAHPCGAEREIARLLAREIDELLHIQHRHLRVDDDQARLGLNVYDRRDRLDRIVRCLVHDRVEQIAGRDEQNGIAIGSRSDDGLRARTAACPGTVVDNNTLAEPLPHVSADQPRVVVAAAAWSEWHDEANGPYRVLLRVGRPAYP